MSKDEKSRRSIESDRRCKNSGSTSANSNASRICRKRTVIILNKEIRSSISGATTATSEAESDKE